MSNSGKISIMKLVVSIIIAELAGVIGSFFTTPAISSWYQFLIKPSFSPPNWLFAPVWTTLFLLMGIAAYLVWSEGWGKIDVKIALSIYGVQILLNVLWSVLFFGAQSPSSGFLEIIVLWIVIVLNILVFYRVSRKAAYLLIPYIIWVSFAAILNYSIWQLNPWPYGQLIQNILILQWLSAL